MNFLTKTAAVAAVAIALGLAASGAADAGYTVCNPWGCFYQPICVPGYWGPFGWVPGYCG